MLELHADFLSDLQALAQRELQQRSIGKPRHRKLQGRHEPDALTKLLTVEHRLVPQRRRRSVWSDVLISRPADAKMEAVKRLAIESETGGDLSQYLGRGVGRAEPDVQFNDWGLTHFHLGDRQPGRMFSKGTSDLLFVMVTLDTLYLVDIGDHKSFEDPSLFEAMLRNWPELLAGSRVPNVVPGSCSMSAERAARFRSKGFTTLTQAKDGNIYFWAGLGQMFNGVSLRVRGHADRTMTRVRDFQLLCERSLDRIVTEAAKFGVFIHGQIRLRLCVVGAALVAEDLQRRFWIGLDEGGTLQISGARLM